MKNLTWQNPEQLFVAQELINKVKSKCCGIKVNKEKTTLIKYNFGNSKTRYTIPSTVTRIAPNAFQYGSLLELTIPETVSQIDCDFDAFNISQLYINSETPPASTVESFYPANKWIIPYGSRDRYVAQAPWSTATLIYGSMKISDTVKHTQFTDKEYYEMTFSRTVKTENVWQGIYIPFDLEINEDVLAQGEVATLSNVSGDVLEWTTQTSGTIPAGTPFIFLPNSKYIVFYNPCTTLYSSDHHNPITKGGYKVCGTYEDIEYMKDFGAYALAGGVFKKADSNDKILKRYRIYILPATSGAAPALKNRIDGVEVTAIDLVQSAECGVQSSEFNLSGQKVDAGYKGIVIRNGKKVIRK